MPAADGFIPYAAWLAGPPERAVPGPVGTDAAESDAPLPAAADLQPPVIDSLPPSPQAAPLPAVASCSATAETLRDVRLFRARLAEALDHATATLVRELAYAVLGRELRSAPVDVAELAARILREHPAAAPVVIHHPPGEVVELGVPARSDPALAPGDVIVAFTDGEIDARLGVRLAVVLEAWS